MDWLKCNICFNTYNESSLRPRSLSCGHTFCEKCLNKTIENETLTCPQCRKLHEIKSALDLPINFIAEGMLKSLNTCSQDVNEGAISKPIEGESNTYDKSETHSSLKSLLEQEERSLSEQKELLKTSAGMCNDHPCKECMFRCSLHKSWVCEQCIEGQGDHPKHNCKITTFMEEIKYRRQAHKKSLEDDGKSCDKTLSLIEGHISYLRDKREHHICLVNSLQDLVNIHKKEEENLQTEITSFQNITEKGKNIKQRLLAVEATVLNAATLAESNAARDMVKNKKTEARTWINTYQREVDEWKLKRKKSMSSAMATKLSLEYREKYELLQEELEKTINKSGQIEKLANKLKSRYIEFTKKPICDILTSDTLAGLITCWDTYVTHTHEHQRWGRIMSRDGSILMQDLRSVQPPSDALVINLSDVIENLPSPRLVYLNFSTKDTPLGRLVIRVNEKAPKRALQLIYLCVGQTGLTYSGSKAIIVSNKGNPDENLFFTCYLNTNNTYSAVKLFPDLEKDEKRILTHKQGLVLMPSSIDDAGFRILTRDNLTSKWIGPAIGEVVSGLPVLEKILRDNLVYEWDVNKSQVTISESGLVIDSSCEK